MRQPSCCSWTIGECAVERPKKLRLTQAAFPHQRDWRRIAVRYDRCAHFFFSAIALAATVIFWLNQ